MKRSEKNDEIKAVQLEFPQIAVGRQLNLIKVPICRFFNCIRVAVHVLKIL